MRKKTKRQCTEKICYPPICRSLFPLDSAIYDFLLPDDHFHWPVYHSRLLRYLCFRLPWVAAEWLLGISRTHVRCWTPYTFYQHITAGYLASEHIHDIYHHETTIYKGIWCTKTCHNLQRNNSSHQFFKAQRQCASKS